MLDRLRRLGFQRGLLGTSRGWLLVWAGLTGVRLLRRFTRKEPETVFSQELKPGETLVIAHGRVPAEP